MKDVNVNRKYANYACIGAPVNLLNTFVLNCSGACVLSGSSIIRGQLLCTRRANMLRSVTLSLPNTDARALGYLAETIIAFLGRT